MKYSVAVKLIALLLCAASLLGAVGSGVGIFIMTENDLYDRTVEDMLQDRVRLENESVAYMLAARYASETLGGAPEALYSRRFQQAYGGVLNGEWGYAILDENGEAVKSVNPEFKDTMRTHSFPVTGQYIHLISEQTEEEKYPAATDPVPEAASVVEGGSLYIYDAIPEEPATVCAMTVAVEDGGYYEYCDRNLGYVYKNPQGYPVCVLTGLDIPVEPSRMLTVIVLQDANGTLLYEARAEAGVGYFTYGDSNGGSQRFQSILSMDTARPSAVEETVAYETVAAPTEMTEQTEAVETVPPTVAETVSATVPETQPEPPQPKPEINIPKDQAIEVQKIHAVFASGEEAEHEDIYGIGRIRQEDGKILFTSYEHWDFATGPVFSVHFLGEEDTPVFCVEWETAVGELKQDDQGRITYEWTLPVPKPVETVPETTAETAAPTEAETVPPTVPETVAETVPETVPEAAAASALIAGKSLEEYDIQRERYYDRDSEAYLYADYVYVTMPEYTVEIYWDQESIANREMYQVLDMVREYRQQLLPLLGISILLFVITGVYLCGAAGHKPRTEEIRAGGLNRTPLDLYLCAAGFGIPGLCVLLAHGSNYFLRKDLLTGCAFGIGMGYCACLLAVGFLLALVAQIKTPGGFWWRNTLCAHSVRLCFRFGQWLEAGASTKIFPALERMIKALWTWTVRLAVWTARATERTLIWCYRFTEKIFLWTGAKAGAVFRWTVGKINRFLSLLPLTWQWLLVGFLMFLMMGIVFATNGEELLMLLSMSICIGLIVYGAHCFGSLLDSTKKMSEGDLDAKVDDKLMVGAFQTFADALNALAGVAVTAAQKQLKSERMKTELITNVSHDIKTPLTSIINYVDLLRKPHTPEEGEQYMEVLDRQSQRLKKLVEDLMDMSKASTGNMSVEITRLDAVESVNQALGEFADKLEKARITPVFRHTEVEVPIMADGRQVWRVLSNLLGNAVKYAMPGTRLYLDLTQMDEMVVLSIKNISRDELNIDAEELMERFVRGDDSRNTEGSGLGLNIAKSLMELQKGQMQLLVDGDLFKVTLSFPKA